MFEDLVSRLSLFPLFYPDVLILGQSFMLHRRPRSTIERFKTRAIMTGSTRPNTMLRLASRRSSIITRAGAILRCPHQVLKPIERVFGRDTPGSCTLRLLPVIEHRIRLL
jgi:hypothetical protein